MSQPQEQAMHALGRLIAHEFPVKRNFIYLMNAAVAPLPLRSSQAVCDYAFEFTNCGNLREQDYWLPLLAKTRELAAGLLDCSPECIAFGKNTTWGLILASLLLPVESGEEVITPADEFPANYYPWLPLVDRGIRIIHVPQQNHRIPLSAISASFSDKTRLVTHSTVQYFSGFQQDLAGLAQLCLDRKTFLVLDGIQSLGAIPFSVKSARPSMLSADAHKWLLGPEGVSLLYVSPETIPLLRNDYRGWTGIADPMNFNERPQDSLPHAGRFEEGAIGRAGIAAFHESLSLLLEVGIDTVRERILGLTGYLIQELSRRSYHVLSPHSSTDERSGIVTFEPKHDAKALNFEFRKRKILISARNGCLRISPHFYNDTGEINVFLENLDALDR
ncbi:MAG: aminotransferase class V-fold PLP-dependent enzyme [Candidatus Wallbacteria bacterium]|nr:aminotransferase class V-fold PLP-dependent enzyme [Candidatus Wallbacteria bacterium]